MQHFNSNDLFLVTGASSGIGRSIAIQLIEQGASVIGLARSYDGLSCVKNSCCQPDRFYVEQMDLTKDINALPQFVTSLKLKYGKLKGMAYCAGVADISPTQLFDYEKVLSVYNINLFSALMMAKGFGDRRVNSGRGSSMVFISSVAGHAPERGMAIYSGSKAALSSSIKAIAKELAPQGVRANCISPSDIKTSDKEPRLNEAERLARYPMGIGDVKDVANLALYLLSDEASWITAQDYIVDCGLY